MPSPSSIEIRSYRNVFDLERRVYRIDRVRLNPGGVPLRGVLYGVLLELAVVALGRLPLCGPALAVLPWFARDLALPVGGAALLCVVRVDGRPFHRASWALLRFAASPHELSGLAPHRSPGARRIWRIPDLVVLCDGSEPRLRRMRFTGPGAALIAVAHERTSPGEGALRRGRRVGVRALAGGTPMAHGVVLDLAPGVRLDVDGHENPDRATSSGFPARN
jgi:hypothetical protein